jgi:hypothetical protein
VDKRQRAERKEARKEKKKATLKGQKLTVKEESARRVQAMKWKQQQLKSPSPYKALINNKTNNTPNSKSSNGKSSNGKKQKPQRLFSDDSNGRTSLDDGDDDHDGGDIGGYGSDEQDRYNGRFAKIEFDKEMFDSCHTKVKLSLKKHVVIKMLFVRARMPAKYCC